MISGNMDLNSEMWGRGRQREGEGEEERAGREREGLVNEAHLFVSVHGN